MEAAECGATALAIVLGYYGLFLPLEKIREDCGVSRDGSRAINMVKAARTYGMDAQGLKKEPDELRELTFPLILHWNFNHFIVLEGIVGTRVFINDPAEGRRIITFSELDDAFTGIALSIRPGEDFQSSGSRTTIRNMLVPKIRTEVLPIAFLILAGIAMLVPGIAIPMASQVFIDEVALANRESLLVPILLFIAFFIVLQVLITWLRELCLAQWGTDLSFRLTRSFFRKVLTLPVRFFDQRYAGEIASRVSLNEEVAGIITGRGATAVLDIVIAVVYLVLLFTLSIPLTLIACCIAFAHSIFLYRFASRQVDLSRRVVLEQGRLQGISCAGIQMIESLKSGGQESEFFGRWAGYHARFANTLRSQNIASIWMSIVPALITGIGTTAILFAASLLILSGSITIGFFFAYQALLANFLQPFLRLISVGGELSELEGSLQRIADVERNVPAQSRTVDEVPELPGGRAGKLNGRLELVDVTFGYNPLDLPLIDSLTLTVPAGTRTALVGSSGCGKSTLAKLAAGLYEPWSGEIRIDGRPFGEIPAPLRHPSLAFVSQDFVIFEGTIRENITLWDRTLRDPEIIQAARDARIDDLVSSLGGGYDHALFEGGKNLSGGERQRLEIARALAGDPTILILDEATSALDPDTEKQVEQNIRRRGCTCLVIAHRLSTVRDCDEIIVIDRGTIVERGTHDSLMSARGAYFCLVSAEGTPPPEGGVS
jgi:NHLM bacteriocin system ABC transporter peptidase/ATP-binding protein